MTIPIREGMIVYDGDPPVRMSAALSMAAGDLADVTLLELGSHTGTHVDAPAHIIPGAPGVEGLAPEALIGPAVVVDASPVPGDIDAAALDALGLPDGVERLLLRTRGGPLWERERFTRDFPGLTEDAARALVDRGVRLVGIDYLSIAAGSDPLPVHRVLLDRGVAIVEGLDLRRVEPGPYELVCLPMLLWGRDGAPARALLGRDG